MSCSGATIEGRISYPDNVPPPSVDGGLPSLHVVLDGGVRSTLSSQDGRFAFYDVPTGRYTVDIHSPVYIFSQPREKFSVMDLVKNPSFLALIVPLVMVWLLPKLTESMLDPEEFKQAQEEMGNAADPSTLIKGFFGGGGDANNDEDSD
ncbi:hypothetical protein DYB32_009801 [Aphanomyces invadans]|uniref:ER membrane protein complex subunit 7 beta-sandwich domain-containing protein n=1 Tax=Aphanomyces invadans TaxID=157072 RepID=A0A3R6WEY4_9STRA|nr:hypothetical protein DYB32_009801 [Aphanomyces invadans]